MKSIVSISQLHEDISFILIGGRDRQYQPHIRFRNKSPVNTQVLNKVRSAFQERTMWGLRDNIILNTLSLQPTGISHIRGRNVHKNPLELFQNRSITAHSIHLAKPSPATTDLQPPRNYNINELPVTFFTEGMRLFRHGAHRVIFCRHFPLGVLAGK